MLWTIEHMVQSRRAGEPAQPQVVDQSLDLSG
jgi:hypothetical protein